MISDSSSNVCHRAVFLDRDGVLLRSDVVDGKPIAIQEMERLEILPGVKQACRDLHAAGFKLVMVTNQPDVGRRLVARDVVDRMNKYLSDLLELDDVRVCYHSGAEECDCRKPNPGMLKEAAIELDLDLARSIMVGDRWRDIEAGRRVGCRTVYIEWGHGEMLRSPPDYIAASLFDAVPWIVGKSAEQFQTSIFEQGH